MIVDQTVTAVIRAAALATLEKVGLSAFKATSLFGSNERSELAKKAA